MTKNESHHKWSFIINVYKYESKNIGSSTNLQEKFGQTYERTRMEGRTDGKYTRILCSNDVNRGVTEHRLLLTRVDVCVGMGVSLVQTHVLIQD